MIKMNPYETPAEIEVKPAKEKQPVKEEIKIPEPVKEVKPVKEVFMDADLDDEDELDEKRPVNIWMLISLVCVALAIASLAFGFLSASRLSKSKTKWEGDLNSLNAVLVNKDHEIESLSQENKLLKEELEALKTPVVESEPEKVETNEAVNGYYKNKEYKTLLAINIRAGSGTMNDTVPFKDLPANIQAIANQDSTIKMDAKVKLLDVVQSGTITWGMLAPGVWICVDFNGTPYVN